MAMALYSSYHAGESSVSTDFALEEQVANLEASWEIDSKASFPQAPYNSTSNGTQTHPCRFITFVIVRSAQLSMQLLLLSQKNCGIIKREYDQTGQKRWLAVWNQKVSWTGVAVIRGDVACYSLPYIQ